MIQPKNPGPLLRLVGEQLSAVTFVHDYLQFQFDGPGMTIFNPVCIRQSNGNLVRQGEANWRDVLCGQISKVVREVGLDDEDLSIHFQDGSHVAVSLRDQDYRGPEAVNFVDGESIVVF